MSTNFALREVSTAAHGEQQTHLRLIVVVVVVDHGVWPMNFNEKKIEKQNLVTKLFSLYSTWFIWQVSVGLLVIPSRNCNCHDQLGYGGVFFTKFKKEATRQQSTKIKLHRLLAIILMLRLVLRYCWLVVVLGQNERCHDRSLFDAWCESAEAFFDRFARKFLAKRSSNGEFGEKLGGHFSSWLYRTRRSDLAQCTFEYLVHALRLVKILIDSF
jgi:hypothetical protein